MIGKTKTLENQKLQAKPDESVSLNQLPSKADSRNAVSVRVSKNKSVNEDLEEVVTGDDVSKPDEIVEERVSEISEGVIEPTLLPLVEPDLKPKAVSDRMLVAINANATPSNPLISLNGQVK